MNSGNYPYSLKQPVVISRDRIHFLFKASS